MGDLHFGDDSAGTWAPHLAHLAESADVLLLAGDLTRVGRADEARVLADEIEGVTIPIVGVLGNHDFHSDEPHEVASELKAAGVTILEGDATTIMVGGESLGIAGTKGFGGGFAGVNATAFGEPEMKAFVAHTTAMADELSASLGGLKTDHRVALLHYSPVKDTVQGERPEIFPFLGSYLLAEAVDAGGAELAIHGHAHHGRERGVTSGGVHVRNVALPVIHRSYAVYCIGEDR